jgi:flavin-dependent dehydrogenase
VQKDDQISGWLSGARQCFETKGIPSISYLSDSFVGDGFLMVGDSAMFIDPIFSAGVMLAMRGADFATDVISEGLRRGDVSAATFRPYEEKIRKPIAKMHKIITNWYDIMASRQRNHIFRLSQQAPLMREQLVVLLSGGYEKADMDAFLQEPAAPALTG